ncbi:phage baseplate assembly protein V [Roseospira marina]|uniref:Phage baseplate assembly protein V n=1 Tax=Roseospira marina TaxID=140057 RepID=A0A5M6I3L2_9PROT|nr:phage baseplate assembly protein V [Roseospira marina]KAA5602801.1 phage baseplate assembly protein V [Roseospira marina]MBB4316226.1 phage baseplate assembly protein V [Roseospira marina]MBB5089429.1 phage baseplate assembly protein V [Roseospira marina]
MGRDHDIDTADLHRRAGNMLRVGTVAAVDHGRARVRVTIAGRASAWLPWPADVGRNFIAWRPLRPGQQVLVAAPSGDPANAVIVQTLYSGALPAPDTDPEADAVHYDDGTVHRYHTGDHEHRLDLRGSNGTARVLTGTAETVVAPDRIELRVGASEIVITAATITIRAGRIDLNP